MQAELEHRTPKSRYLRTSKKHYAKQLTQIKRRQARIHRICEKLNKSKKLTSEEVACEPFERYNIGKSQNYPVCISQFLRSRTGDPAVKVQLLFPLVD